MGWDVYCPQSLAYHSMLLMTVSSAFSFVIMCIRFCLPRGLAPISPFLRFPLPWDCYSSHKCIPAAIELWCLVFQTAVYCFQSWSLSPTWRIQRFCWNFRNGNKRFRQSYLCVQSARLLQVTSFADTKTGKTGDIKGQGGRRKQEEECCRILV